MDQDIVFKALSDSHRRTLLDLLREQDGQTLSELEAHLPMTRFGVMKHLKILEEAGLVTSEKVGRSKHHYLNPVPIQLVYDRWVSRYAQPFTSKLTELKFQMENTMSNTIKHKYQIFIMAPAEKIWDALTNGEITPSYYFGAAVESDWQAGSPYSYEGSRGTFIDGKVLEIEPPHKLVQTFTAHWSDEAKAIGESKVTWLIEQEEDACKLILIHEDLKNDPFVDGFYEGWTRIISSLKTLLETGETLTH